MSVKWCPLCLHLNVLIGKMPVMMKIITQTIHHDDVIKWKHFCVTGPLRGESTGHLWIPLTKASDMDFWSFLWYAPEQTVQQTVYVRIWDAIALTETSL